MENNKTDFFDAYQQGHHKRKIIFIGTDIDFSQHSLAAVSTEFPSLEPVRLPKFADIALYSGFDDHIAAFVFAQSHSEHLAQSFAACKSVCGSAQIVLSYSDIDHARDALSKLVPDLGLRAVSFLPMNRSIDCWLAIVGLVLQGDTYLAAELVEPVCVPNPQAEAEVVLTAPQDLQCSMPKATTEETQQVGSLTIREAEVLTLVAEGLQNKTIANALDVTEHTIKLHIHNLIRKLGVNNRTAAAAWYHSNTRDNSQVALRHTADG